MIENINPITSYVDLIGRQIYGESLLNYRSLYIYTVIGCGDFLNKDENKTNSRIILRNDSPTQDLVGHSFPIGKRSRICEESISPDEIGVNYFLTEKEALDGIAHKYRNVDVTKFDGKTINDLYFHAAQTKTNNDGYDVYIINSNYLCARPANENNCLEWYLCRGRHFKDKKLIGYSLESEGHVIHINTNVVNFWD